MGDVLELENNLHLEWEVLQKPFIIRNFFSEEQRLNLLLEERLVSNVGTSSIMTSKRCSNETRKFNFLEYLSYMNETTDKNPWYAANWHNEDILTAVLKNIDLPGLFYCWLEKLPNDIKPNWLWLFLGPRESSTALHIDVMMSSAWNILFSGTKRWRFLSPSESIKQNILDKSFSSQFSKDRYIIEAVQHPGDIIYTPSGWAHEVVNTDPTISLTGNFINESNYRYVKHYLKGRNKFDWIKVIEKLETIFISEINQGVFK
ncbi:cupin-like domain-containing protein [Peribacillus sp. NPDC096622]|uniref:cupin-like domain-containing protein n=1 Tax=Peribacillus sp. NPDC096622 TaxID=3364396 RepID=UPI00381CB22F